MNAGSEDRSVLKVDGLTVVGRPTDVEIISEVSVRVERGKILGLIGESGSGKTTLGLALLAHYKRGTAIVSGTVEVTGENLLDRSDKEVRALRGRTVAYIPQSPASALNPALRLRTHRSVEPTATRAAVGDQSTPRMLFASPLGVGTSHTTSGAPCPSNDEAL